MLTKLEITQKKAKSAGQLDLVETISTDDKIRKKRTLLIISISATIGLSLIFAVYSSIGTFHFSPPKLPKISIAPKNTDNTEVQVASALGSDRSNWDITIMVNPSSSETDNLKSSSKSLIKSYLPQGLDIKEAYLPTSSNQSFTALILVPQNNIYINLIYNSPNQENFNLGLQKIIPAIYWSKVQSAN